MSTSFQCSVMHLTYDMRIGGTEMVIKNIIEDCEADTFDMSIFCIESPLGPWGHQLKNCGIQVTSTSRKPGFDISLIKAIRAHIIENRIDVLHCHQYTPWVYGAIAALGTKTKTIFTEHGRFYPDSSSWKRKIINPWLCRITQHITSISEATKQALVDFENIPAKKIEVIYNGIREPIVDISKINELRTLLKLDNNTEVLGTIARFDPIKNHLMMLEAFSIVLKSKPNTILLMVGDGDERQNIENKLDALGITQSVIMTGYDPMPLNYLALMDVFLLSSLSEGTSMTLLEAMALGKPCVVTDAGGNAEIIEHSENGLVTENNNPSAFADSILTLLNDKDRVKYMKIKAKSRFSNMFIVNNMSRKFASLYINDGKK